MSREKGLRALMVVCVIVWWACLALIAVNYGVRALTLAFTGAIAVVGALAGDTMITVLEKDCEEDDSDDDDD